MLKTLTIAATALLMASAPAYATFCYERPVVTPNNAPRPYAATVMAGSNGAQGYGGVPGQFGCPIKAAVGTCVDPNESLSEKVNSYVGQFVAYDGNVPDTEEYRKGIFIGPIFIGTPWKPGSC